MAGKEVAEVVNRCEDAKETNKLDLSRCDLTKVPDAVFLLMRSTVLESCNLSENLIKRIPSKLPTQFCALKELDLSTNHLASLPEELRQLEDLKTLNLSHNHFLELPTVIFALDSLQALSVVGNDIKEVNVSRLKSLSNLIEVNLQENPLLPATHSQLLEVENISILLTPQDPELDAVD